jgi:hypothetical protein
MKGLLKLLGLLLVGFIGFMFLAVYMDQKETEKTGLDTETRADLRECAHEWFNTDHPLPADTGFSAEDTKKMFYALCMGRKKQQRDLKYGPAK